jgi:hypothetical protein
MWKRDRIVDPGAPDGEVGVVDLDEYLPVPQLQLAEMAAVKVPAQVDRGGQSGRRRGSEAEAVLATVVVEAEIDRFENQRRRLPHGVLPGHGRAADANSFLRQNPVAGGVVTSLGGHGDAGNGEAAVAIATQMQSRLVDLQQAQTQRHAR